MSHDPAVANAMVEARALRARMIRDAFRKLFRLSHKARHEADARRPGGAPDLQGGALAS